tara:strand:+ start:135 stop:257 length:123 start_codon:yes stop_codon:yes gene_type:complete
MKIKIKYIYWENAEGEIINLWNTEENRFVLDYHLKYKNEN